MNINRCGQTEKGDRGEQSVIGRKEQGKRIGGIMEKKKGANGKGEKRMRLERTDGTEGICGSVREVGRMERKRGGPWKERGRMAK